MKVPPIVWKILKQEETASLSLQHNEGRSTWQAGEILNKSHYKYLEIKTRAEKFFKVFITHYNLYGKLIPDGLNLNEDFAKYITNAIEKRSSLKNNIADIENPAYKKMQLREPLICKAILELKESKSIHAQNLYGVIMDFDRYNNFRVLPKEVQELSGFKRRNSTRFKKHLKMSVNLNPYSIHRIKELYERNTKSLKNEAFVVLDKEIIRINCDEDVLKDFAGISLYVFKEKKTAEEYKELVDAYLGSDRDPRKGLKFWPQFRNIIKLAYNYDLVHNIAPTRKNQHMAMQRIDAYYYNKNNKANYKDKMNKPEE